VPSIRTSRVATVGSRSYRRLAPVDHRSGGEDLGQIAAVIDGGRQQQAPGARRHAGGSSTERPLQPRGQRQRRWQERAAAESVRPEQDRQLDQRERIAAGLLAHGGRELPSVRVEQRLGRRVVQAAEPEIGQSRVIENAFHALADCHEHDERLVIDPSGDEGQHVGGGAIQPVRILYHYQQRRALGRAGKQLEYRERDQKAIGCLSSLSHPEGGQERRPLRRG
jgi:hypothetical protein